MTRYRPLFLASITVLAVACDDLGFLAPGEFCTRELRTRFTPADTSILVGQAFEASVQLSSCGGAQQLTDVFTWYADDPSVATVDGPSGRVVGRAPGTTRVRVSGQRYGSVGGLQVSVRDSLP